MCELLTIRTCIECDHVCMCMCVSCVNQLHGKNIIILLYIGGESET